MSHVKTIQFNTDNVSRKLYYANILICLIRNSSEEGYLVQVDKFFISFFFFQNLTVYKGFEKKQKSLEWKTVKMTTHLLHLSLHRFPDCFQPRQDIDNNRPSFSSKKRLLRCQTLISPLLLNACPITPTWNQHVNYNNIDKFLTQLASNVLNVVSNAIEPKYALRFLSKIAVTIHLFHNNHMSTAEEAVYVLKYAKTCLKTRFLLRKSSFKRAGRHVELNICTYQYDITDIL